MLGKRMHKLWFSNYEKEVEKSKITFTSNCTKEDLINELNEILTSVPKDYSLTEKETDQLIILLKKVKYTDQDITSIERIKIMYETASQSFINSNNVVLYLTIFFSFLTSSVILLVSLLKMDIYKTMIVLSLTLVLFIFLYISNVLTQFKQLERDHRKLGNIYRLINLIINTKEVEVISKIKNVDESILLMDENSQNKLKKDLNKIESDINKFLILYKYSMIDIGSVSNSISIKKLLAEIVSDIEKARASVSGIAIAGFFVPMFLLIINIFKDYQGTVILAFIYFFILIGLIMLLFRGYKRYLIKIKELTKLKELIEIYLDYS